MCNKHAYEADKRMTDMTQKVTEITLWRESTITPKLVDMDSFLHNFTAQFDGIIKNVQKCQLTKLERREGQEMHQELAEKIDAMDVRIDEVRDNVLTLEHYCERYIPVQV